MRTDGKLRVRGLRGWFYIQPNLTTSYTTHTQRQQHSPWPHNPFLHRDEAYGQVFLPRFLVVFTRNGPRDRDQRPRITQVFVFFPHCLAYLLNVFDNVLHVPHAAPYATPGWKSIWEQRVQMRKLIPMKVLLEGRRTPGRAT